uniref:non-specific serine/threonine protein kinase n=1 Tax=Anthurium amnicola TaxID=1678845 RepID=A0A1D1YSF5_9ARAE
MGCCRYVRGFLLFVVPFLLSPEMSSPALVHGQNSTMASLSRALNSTLWNTSNSDPCNWKGVDCTEASPSQVTRLTLSGFRLSNSSSLPLICRVDSLQSLDLSGNSFNSIPPDFITDCGKLTGLKLLNFSGNKLSGNLPTTLSSLKNLQVLDLSFNLLKGTVDSSLEGLVQLRSLNLSFNFFNGSIPTKLGRTVALQELSLSHNFFQGSKILPEIVVYKNLSLLDLSFNSLNGSVPDSITSLSKLEVLILSSNFLTGRVPHNLSTMRNLHWFAANTNSFTGPVPQGITRHLQVLDLSFNELGGSIPPDLLSLPNLESVDLSSNLLAGPIPSNLSRRLFRLRLGQNRLNGSIPPTIGELTKLAYLELEANKLDGEVPARLGGLANLTLLNLADNNLKGVLPKELGNLSKLVVMKLQKNQINGTIPHELFGLGQLLTLNLSRNMLSGTIPPSISSLTKLSSLNLECNNLNGTIPKTIGIFRDLRELQLGNNKLSGDIPRMPESLSTALNLSNNLFSGPIPTTLSLPQLEILDLSNNKFTGEVPNFLADMNSLTLLILSYNQLSGTLPQFRHWVTVEYAENWGLVNRTTPAVSPTSPSKRRTSSALVIIVSVAAALVGSGVAAAVLVFVVSRRFYRVKDERVETGEHLPQVVEGVLLNRDRTHGSQIDFARAMEEVGNPGNVLGKSKFSTYYKAAMPGGTTYCVKKLNWSDKIFQMGNQGRFRQELEAMGRLSNSNVMAPLAYVLTADSVYLFYEHVHKCTLFDFLHNEMGDVMDWPCRYSVALGIAQGLTFLHGLNQPVLLLDLTTKSILMKSLREPKIADAELFKVIDLSRSTGSISTLAGSVGYIAPEYAYTMRVTAAGNIYSFGVVLLELLTGKPPVSKGIELAKWALSYSSRIKEWEQILDPSVCHASLAVRSQMLSVMNIALSCVSHRAEARPKTRNVLKMLFNAR